MYSKRHWSGFRPSMQPISFWERSSCSSGLFFAGWIVAWRDCSLKGPGRWDFSLESIDVLYHIFFNAEKIFMFLQLKKDVDLEKAGLQFISYQELQATVCEQSGNDHSSDTAAAADEDVSDDEKLDKRTMEGGTLVQQEGPDCDEEEEEEDEANHLVENIKIRDPRRGTEMKLLGLRMGENTATVVAQQITVCLQCNRWGKRVKYHIHVTNEEFFYTQLKAWLFVSCLQVQGNCRSVTDWEESLHRSMWEVQCKHHCSIQALHAAPLQRRPGIPGPSQCRTCWPCASGLWTHCGLP